MRCYWPSISGGNPKGRRRLDAFSVGFGGTLLTSTENPGKRFDRAAIAPGLISLFWIDCDSAPLDRFHKPRYPHSGPGQIPEIPEIRKVSKSPLGQFPKTPETPGCGFARALDSASELRKYPLREQRPKSPEIPI